MLRCVHDKNLNFPNGGKRILNESVAKYNQSRECIDNLYKSLHESKAAQEEAEEKLTKVREAFEILGIVKEV